MNGYRKFALALLASIAGSLLCWYHCVSGSEWVTAQSLILALYKAANVTDKHLGGLG